jgi:hypothetical protein
MDIRSFRALNEATAFWRPTTPFVRGELPWDYDFLERESIAPAGGRKGWTTTLLPVLASPFAAAVISESVSLVRLYQR